jgi:hypothetical protein
VNISQIKLRSEKFDDDDDDDDDNNNKEKKEMGDTSATAYFPRYLQIGFDIQRTVHCDTFL